MNNISSSLETEFSNFAAMWISQYNNSPGWYKSDENFKEITCKMSMTIKTVCDVCLKYDL